MLSCGLTYSSHPVSCATALANLKVYEDEEVFHNVQVQGEYLEGILFYTRAKVVTSRWPDPSTSQVDLGFPQPK